jgi:hypothetical protein
MLCAAPTAVGMRIRTALDIDDDWQVNAGQLAGGLTVRTTAVGRIAKVDAAHEGADPVAHPGGAPPMLTTMPHRRLGHPAVHGSTHQRRSTASTDSIP